MECALPSVRDALRRLRGSGLSLNLRQIHKAEDDWCSDRDGCRRAEQQLPAEIELAGNLLRRDA